MQRLEGRRTLFCSRAELAARRAADPVDDQHGRPRSTAGAAALVNKGFTPRRVAGSRAEDPRDLRRADRRASRRRGAATSCATIAAPLPMIVIGDLLGVEPEDRDKLLRWSDDLIAAHRRDARRRRWRCARCSAFDEYAAYHRARRRRPARAAAARRPDERPRARRDRRRAARRRGAAAGEPADPGRRRRDHAPRDHAAAWTQLIAQPRRSAARCVDDPRGDPDARSRRCCAG